MVGHNLKAGFFPSDAGEPGCCCDGWEEALEEVGGELLLPWGLDRHVCRTHHSSVGGEYLHQPVKIIVDWLTRGLSARRYLRQIEVDRKRCCDGSAESVQRCSVGDVVVMAPVWVAHRLLASAFSFYFFKVDWPEEEV